MVGAPSKFGPLTHKDHQIFAKVTKGLTGASYEPLAVATQVVSGTMHIFLCNASVVHPESKPYLALVYGADNATGEIKLERIAKLVEEKEE